MNKKYIYIFALFALLLSLFGFVFATGNEVWHNAKDVQEGVFGQDEQDYTQNYTFINLVKFHEEIKVDSIKSSSEGKTIIIQLG